MAITLDNAPSTRQLAGGASSLTYSFTRASGNGVVFVAVAVTNSNTITGVTLGGESMTQVGIAPFIGGGQISLYLFRIRNPSTSGAQNIVVTASASSTFILATTISFSGDTKTGTNANATVTTGTTLANSITVADQSWCVLAGIATAIDVTAGTGTTATTTANPLIGRNGPRSGAGTTSMSINAGASDLLASIICEVEEDTASAPATSYTLSAGTATTCGTASGNFTVTPNGTSSATITPSDGGAGGTFTPSTVAFDGTSSAKTFTYTPSSMGTKTISTTNSGSLTNPSNVSYSPLRYSLTDTTSPDGTNIRVLTPWNYSSTTGAHLVIYHHGVGETYTALLSDSLKASCVDALLEAGYILAGSDAAGNNWGNAAGQATYTSLYAWAVVNRRIKKVLFWSQSMGGCTGLNCLADERFPVVGWYGIYPVCSLASMFAGNAGTFAGQIRSAFGIASDGSDYASKTSGFDPLLIPPTNYPSVGIRFTASAGDTVVSKTSNSDAMSAALVGRVPEHSVVVCSGDHGDPSHFQPTDIVDFFSRCVNNNNGIMTRTRFDLRQIKDLYLRLVGGVISGLLKTTERTATPTGTTASLLLEEGNHQTINLGSASGNVTLTLTTPSGSAAGTMIVVQGSTARDITWAVSSGSIIWMGAEPDWIADGAGKSRIVAWRWNGSVMRLAPSEVSS